MTMVLISRIVVPLLQRIGFQLGKTDGIASINKKNIRIDFSLLGVI
jgi:hypothetical protein